MITHIRPVDIFTPQSTRDGSATTTQRNSDISANRPRSSSPGGIIKKSPSTHDPQLFPDDGNKTKGRVGQAK
jgi:hypothetical protein